MVTPSASSDQRWFDQGLAEAQHQSLGCYDHAVIGHEVTCQRVGNHHFCVDVEVSLFNLGDTGAAHLSYVGIAQSRFDAIGDEVMPEAVGDEVPIVSISDTGLRHRPIEGVEDVDLLDHGLAVFAENEAI